MKKSALVLAFLLAGTLVSCGDNSSGQESSSGTGLETTGGTDTGGGTTSSDGGTGTGTGGEPASGCGNGIWEIGEQCDDGNSQDLDGCHNDCTLATCGDGIVQSYEECDDANLIETDACTRECVALNVTGVWSKTFNTVDEQTLEDLTIDSAGNIIIVGKFELSVDFGGGLLTTPNAANGDLYIAKFSPEGQLLWNKDLEGTSSDRIVVATNAANEIFLSGTAYQSIDFGGGVVSNIAGNGDIYLAKLSADGGHLWSKSFPANPTYQTATDIAVDTAGNVVITGVFGGTPDLKINLGGQDLAPIGKWDIFLAKFSDAGAPLWSRSFGTANYDQIETLALDGEETVIGGNFVGTIDFGKGPLATAADDAMGDAYVARFDKNGACLWNQQYGGSNYQAVQQVAVDSQHRILVAGEFRQAINFGLGPIEVEPAWLDYSHNFIAQLDASGQALWNEKIVTPYAGAGWVRAIDFNSADAGVIALCNDFDEVLMYRADGDGTLSWKQDFGETGYKCEDLRIGIDAQDSIIAAGSFAGGYLNFGKGELAYTQEGGSNNDIYLAKFKVP